MRRMFGVCAAALLVTAGCGDDGGSDQIDSAAEFCDELVGTWAAKLAECYGATIDAARAEVVYQIPCARIEEAAAAGHLGFDRAQAEACVAAFGALTCWEVDHQDGPPPGCAEAVPAQVEEGGTCFADVPLECIGGYCEFDACNAPGLCVTFALESESCESDPDYRRCADDLYCDYDTYTCAVPAPPTISDLDEPCGSGEICAEGLYCALVGLEQLCQAQGTGACDAWDACVQGYRCIFGNCTTIKAIGQACGTGTDECVYGAYCRDPEVDGTGTCTGWPGVGGECGPMGSDEYATCIDSWCEGVTNGPLSSPAGRTALVSPVADIVAGTCRPYLGLGEWCEDAAWEACGPAAFCNSGSCAKAYCVPR